MPIRFDSGTLFLDIETHSIDERYSMPPSEYYRLGGYAWGEGPVTITESHSVMLDQIRKARRIVGHNIHAFDLSVLFGPNSIEPVRLAREKRVVDTYTHAKLAIPAPEGVFTGRDGKQRKSTKPEEYRRWYGLDNLAFQLGLEGKIEDALDCLADSALYDVEPVYSEKTGKLLKAVKKVPKPGRCCGYGWIPLDDPLFREYLVRDVEVAREVARGLLGRMRMDDYAWRYQLADALDAQVSRNGVRVDQPVMNERIRSMAEDAAYALAELNQRFGFPLHGKKPLSTNEGKAAVLEALKSVGVKERFLARTDKGALSFSADSVRSAATQAGTPEASELAEVLAMLAGQRSLAELTAESVFPDGRVHPSIDSIQRSGRRSTTKPGLTIWDDSHKDYYIADSDDDVLVEFDFSNADARAVAAMSGDRKFAERFQEGQDGHLINAIAAWGRELVETDPAHYRQKAKAPGHGWSYMIGVRKLGLILGGSLEEAKKFKDGLNRAFPGVVRWQDSVIERARKDGFVTNDWGRKMPITGSTYTQPPALMGQSTTNELVTDGMIRLPDRLLRRLKLGIHDAMLFSLSRKTVEQDIRIVVRCFEKDWRPRRGGQTIHFPLGHGTPARDWKGATH